MKVNKLGSQLAHANVRNNVSQLVANKPNKVSELSQFIISSLVKVYSKTN